MRLMPVAMSLTFSLWSAGASAPTAGARETCPVTTPVRAEPAKDPNADPFGVGPWYLNADRTIWASRGPWRAGARNRVNNKVLWIRPQGTRLEIAGRRLDGPSAPLTARIPLGYPTGFQATSLVFPAAGCWEVTATAGSSQLTFVTEVGPGDNAGAPPVR